MAILMNFLFILLGMVTWQLFCFILYVVTVSDKSKKDFEDVGVWTTGLFGLIIVIVDVIFYYIATIHRALTYKAFYIYSYFPNYNSDLSLYEYLKEGLKELNAPLTPENCKYKIFSKISNYRNGVVLIPKRLVKNFVIVEDISNVDNFIIADKNGRFLYPVQHFKFFKGIFPRDIVFNISLPSKQFRKMMAGKLVIISNSRMSAYLKPELQEEINKKIQKERTQQNV